MKRSIERFFIAVLIALAAGTVAAADTPVKELRWNDLVPKGWDPIGEIRRTAPPGPDGDSPEAMRAMREIWDNAPTNRALDGTRARLPGYVVPLDTHAAGVKEFLLVPYFGACIHSPPPPANQIVHVRLASPAKLRAMEVIWASGLLSVTRTDSWMGKSGYRMEATDVKPYQREGKER